MNLYIDFYNALFYAMFQTKVRVFQ